MTPQETRKRNMPSMQEASSRADATRVANTAIKQQHVVAPRLETTNLKQDETNKEEITVLESLVESATIVRRQAIEQVTVSRRRISSI
jgi:hypothetical protein